MTDEETIDHLFLGCIFSGQVWGRLAQCLTLCISRLPQSVDLFWLS